MKFFFLISLLLLFSTSAWAVAPVVDFNFSPATALTGEQITFNPTISTSLDLNGLYWGFDTDTNINYTRFFLPAASGKIDNFTAANGTDLNTYSGDWNSFADTTGWYNRIYSNQLRSYAVNNGVGGSATFQLNNYDVNFLELSNDTISFTTTFIDFNHIAGSTHDFSLQMIRPGDQNLLANFLLQRSSSGGAITLLSRIRGNIVDTNTVLANDVLKIQIKRKGVYVYDINFTRNGLILASLIDQNLNSDTFRFNGRFTAGGVGTGEGWGVIDDFNWAGGGPATFNPVSPISLTKSENHTFTTSGTKNVCLTAENTDGNATSCHSIEIKDFVQLHVQDDLNFDGIENAIINFDGNTISTNANGDANILTDIITFPLTLTVSKTGYDSRNFYYLTSEGLKQDFTFSLREENISEDISFQFFAPNQTTKLSNRVISVSKSGALSGRQLTDSQGILSFNLDSQDSNYSFLIYPVGIDQNHTLIDYNYSTVTVTIEQARNEADNTLITPNLFTLDIGGLALKSYTSQSLPLSNITILGNTIENYTLRIVDDNSNGQQYSARNYLMQTKGDTSTLSITPYLVDLDELVLVNITVKDLGIGNPTIPNIRLTLQTGINNTLVVAEEQLTNAAGTSKFSFLTQRQYIITAKNSNGTTTFFPLSGTAYISDTSQSFDLFIDFNSSDLNFTKVIVDNNFSPQIDYLTGATASIDVNTSVIGSFQNIYVDVLDQNGSLYSNVCMTTPCLNTFNLNLSSFDSNQAYVRVIVEIGDQNLTYFRSYYILGNEPGLLNILRNLRLSLGDLSLAFIMLGFMFAGFLLTGSNELTNNSARIFILAIIPGFFVYIWWFDNVLIVVGYLGALFGTAGIYLWNRNRSG